MLKTEPELHRVAGKERNHLWLEVLEGPDAGIRVSVPRHSSQYSPELQQDVLDLAVNDVRTFVVCSETRSPPQWRIQSIQPRSAVGQNATDSNPSTSKV